MAGLGIPKVSREQISALDLGDAADRPAPVAAGDTDLVGRVLGERGGRIFRDGRRWDQRLCGRGTGRCLRWRWLSHRAGIGFDGLE